MREQADMLDSKGAMQIRYLDVVTHLGKNSKVVFYSEDEMEKETNHTAIENNNY